MVLKTFVLFLTLTRPLKPFEAFQGFEDLTEDLTSDSDVPHKYTRISKCLRLSVNNSKPSKLF